MNREGNTVENSQFIEPGLYNIKQIIDIIHAETPQIEFLRFSTRKLELKLKFRQSWPICWDFPPVFLNGSATKGESIYNLLKLYIFIAIKFPPAKICLMVNLQLCKCYTDTRSNVW